MVTQLFDENPQEYIFDSAYNIELIIEIPLDDFVIKYVDFIKTEVYVMKVGVADYGMMVWYGTTYDYEAKMDELKEIGFDGTERLHTKTADEAYRKLLTLAEKQMSFATVETGDVESNIKMTAAFGGKYIWTYCSPTARDLETYCRQVNYLERACSKYGIRPAIHNHLGSLVETPEQLDEFMSRCRETWLLLDTGHLAVGGGDVVKTLDKYYDRLAAVHIKDWVMKNPDAKAWYEKGYFTGLNNGNFPVNNEEFIKSLLGKGYDGWIFIEHDTHLREPLLDLRDSRNVLREWGVK